MIVLDASTLILIAKIELLDSFLAGIKLQVGIPAQVARECCSVKKTLDSLVIQKALDQSGISTIRVRDRKLVAKLQVDFGLGMGEAEAIALALKERSELLGIDDKNGINACKLSGIPFTTALNILLREFESGLMDRHAALARLALLAKHGRYSNSILSEARMKLEAGNE